MDLYDGASPELALEVLRDDAMVSAILAPGEDAPEAEVTAAVERSFDTKARQLQDQARASARIAASEAEARRKAEASANRVSSSAEEQIADLRERIGRVEKEGESKAQELEQQKLHSEKEAAEKLDAQRAETDGLRHEIEGYKAAEARRRKRTRKTVGISFIGASVGASGLLLVSGVVTSAMPILAVVLGSALFSLIGFRIGWPSKWSDEAFHWTLVILAFATFVATAIASQ